MNNKQVGKVDNVVDSIKANAMEGWDFARSWAWMTSGIVFFLGILLFLAMKDVEFPGWRRDCVRAVGLVGLGYIVANALAVTDTFKYEQKMQNKKIKNIERRKFFPGVDDNPNINLPPMREQANVVYVCDKCDRDHTDPPEILELKGATGIYYQVMCPKCWQHTRWCESKKEAEEAWNKKERWAIKDPEDA